MLPYGRQDISEADVEAVVEVLRSDFLTQGPMVPRFESAVKTYVGANHAIAVNSATSALHIACLSLELGPGDIMWTSPITFVASANCALYCGASVDFVDIDPDTYNISPLALAKKLEVAKMRGQLPKVVIAVHLTGQPCDMAAISELAQEYGFRVIEDASHAVGARYNGLNVGGCTYSDITVFSFHPVKIITTAEGGMALTNDEGLADRMRSLSSHGITRDVKKMVRPPSGPWYYEQLELGYNYRMNDLQAALGISQMNRLREFVLRRRELAAVYSVELKDLPLKLPKQAFAGESAFHLYVIRCKPEVRKDLFLHLKDAGVGVNLHYLPVYSHPYYSNFFNSYDDFPAAEQYSREAISIPMFPSMAAGDQEKAIRALGEFFRDAASP